MRTPPANDPIYDLLHIDPENPMDAAALDDADCLYRLIESLVQIRKDRGIRQADVAEYMETTQSAVSDFERLGSNPRYTTIQRYARAVGARISGRAVVENDGWREITTASVHQAEDAPRQEILSVGQLEFGS